MSGLSLAQKPNPEYCRFIQQLIKEAVASHHNAGGKKIHKSGIASKVQGKIYALDKKGEWPFGKQAYPTDLTIYRRIEELAEQGDFIVSVRSGSGWYKMNEELFHE